ncbi:unnamed protein product [Parascedosporium putredinis]|uniref:beta-glucosidase n=1 Tax=Parascedosporium putredinis TaxID=1442378 RepID=A0A9P1HBR6_9PEZI|nr:unnamed protein product [Parascedosporium putredinis]CAI8003999.1 unnamed protein product [Parascedosporium putredinis]
MLLWLVDSLILKPGDTLWMAVNEDVDDEFRIGQLVAKTFPSIDFRLVRLRHQTKGACETRLWAGLENIIDIQEKKAISTKANTGAYVFPSASSLKTWAAHSLDAKREDGSELAEYYTSQTIALMLRGHVPFLGIPVENTDFSCVGTPAQLQDLLALLKTNPAVFPPSYNRGASALTLILPPDVPLADVGSVTFAQLAKYRIPFHDIHFGKPCADIYVDDRAVNSNLDTAKEIGWLLDDSIASPMNHGQLTSSRQRDQSPMIEARDFNTIQIIGDRVIKSSKSATILGELYFYSHMPSSLSHVFPAIYAVDLIPETGTYSISMENRRGLTFSHLLVGRSITKGRMSTFLRTLHTIHSSSSTRAPTLSISSDLEAQFASRSPSRTESQVNIYSNYGPKLRSRYHQFKSQYDSLGPLAASLFEKLNQCLDTFEIENKGIYASIIHGDPVFSNAILSKDEKAVSFIDVRCQLGSTITPEGDIHYDLAKVLQSLCGYDHVMFMNASNYNLSHALENPEPLLDEADISLLEELQAQFFSFVEKTSVMKTPYYLPSREVAKEVQEARTAPGADSRLPICSLSYPGQHCPQFLRERTQQLSMLPSLFIAVFAAVPVLGLEAPERFYPSTWGSGGPDGWDEAYEKARDFVSQLTLAEKVNLTTGTGWQADRCDGPLGVRYADKVSAFPAGVNAAATWSRSLIKARGAAMGAEFYGKGIDIQLGPSSEGVVACVKHFILNEQEHFRGSVSSLVNDRVMHEVYLWPFADAVRAGVGSVMCSYNRVNGTYSCENAYTNYLLKNELNFQGFVMSDWGAQHTSIESALNGLDMTMPGDRFGRETAGYQSLWGGALTEAVLADQVPQWRLDDMVVRIMAAYYKVHVGDKEERPDINFHAWTNATEGPVYFVANETWEVVNEHVDVAADHADLIREIGAKSIVLLKNEGVLPLGKPESVAVIGEDAQDNPNGVNWCSNWDLEAAMEAAVDAEVAIVFANANAGENYVFVGDNEGDRNNLTLWNGGDALITAVASINPNTIVVLHTVGPVLIEDYKQHPNITAILWAGLPGQESGNSLVDDLNAGLFIDYRHFDKEDIEPSYEFGFGLSYTTFEYSDLEIELVAEDGPSYEAADGVTEEAPVYGELGSREDFLFPEGFEVIPKYVYSWVLEEPAGPQDIKIDESSRSGEAQRVHPAGGAPGGNPGLYEVVYRVSVTVENTGDVAGTEIVQLYLSHGDSDGPVRVLRGFEDVELEPEEAKTVTFDLTYRDLATWAVEEENWVISKANKTVYVGSSSRDLRLDAELEV